ncbi:hypothetical protein [Rhodoferax sp.]|uniref:hypothetical protein n=1 Tax=Rhodoferax sp. TaxID=50421 RepID=UPI001A0634F6|nr:hypothetical protein [Rhodoferax sp.]MBE0475455.1 hypothetical protein [Rhodoferax sp.]
MLIRLRLYVIHKIQGTSNAQPFAMTANIVMESAATRQSMTTDILTFGRTRLMAVSKQVLR